MPGLEELQPTVIDNLQGVQEAMQKHRKRMKLKGVLGDMQGNVDNVLAKAASIGRRLIKQSAEVAPHQQNSEAERSQKIINTLRRGWNVQDQHHGESGNFSGGTSSHEGGISSINNNSPEINAL